MLMNTRRAAETASGVRISEVSHMLYICTTDGHVNILLILVNCQFLL